MRIDLVGGARPNFVKLAPLVRSIQKEAQHRPRLSFRLIHTHQHWEPNMSGHFFEQLQIPRPDLVLELESRRPEDLGPSIRQAYAQVLGNDPPDLVLVVGDVTSTLAAAQAAKDHHLPLAHVEAGLRTTDLSMPEERNRRETDALADWFFTTHPLASENLIQEGKDPSRIFFVGNVMIDSLIQFKDRAKPPDLWTAKQQPPSYILLTIHRAANVDRRDDLMACLLPIIEAAGDTPIVFPIHPRTKKMLGDWMSPPSVICSDPLPYLEFLYLMQHALGVVTDSGGISEETTALGVPCITLREETERPETVSLGTNLLVGNEASKIRDAISQLKRGNWKKGSIPPKWDGQTAQRIIRILLEHEPMIMDRLG